MKGFYILATISKSFDSQDNIHLIASIVVVTKENFKVLDFKNIAGYSRNKKNIVVMVTSSNKDINVDIDDDDLFKKSTYLNENDVIKLEEYGVK
jgi:hypothetical protein